MDSRKRMLALKKLFAKYKKYENRLDTEFSICENNFIYGYGTELIDAIFDDLISDLYQK